MVKFIFRFLIFFIIIITLFLIYLSYFGIETSKFDSLIKEKANTVNNNIKFEFNKTKIHLDFKDLKLLIKLKNPRILVKDNKISLVKLNLYLSLKSFYRSDFLLEKVNITFRKNDIKDLTKITNLFLPRIINKQLKKVFAKGNLNGEIEIPFKPNGSIGENYLFNGKIINADINLSNKFGIKNLTAAIDYRNNSDLNLDRLKISVEDGSILNLKLLGSILEAEFREDKKNIKSSISTFGELNFEDIKKVTSLLGIKIKNVENFILNSNLKTSVVFDLDKKFKITNHSYSTAGEIKRLQFKLKDVSFIKDFLPSFNDNIVIKNSKIRFSSTSKEQKVSLQGNIKFSDNFENFDLIHSFNKDKKKHSIKMSSSLNETPLKLDNLNYYKKEQEKAQIDLLAEIILDKYFLIKNLNYFDKSSEIKLQKIKFNKNYELFDLNKIKVKTYSDNTKNNDFSVIKSNNIIVNGDVFDAQPLIKSLFTKDDKKIFSKKFNSDVKIDFKKTITGSDDDISNLSMIASIKKGSYNKLSLKGNFSEKEIIEMSIYQIDKNKKSLQVISDRARPFIKHFDFIEGFEGGRLEYDSDIFDKKSQSSLIITDFKVSKVPALAQLLTLASLQGIADTLSGEGIRFESFEMKSYSENNVMNIEDALAMGPAVSILLDGYVDKGKTVSLRGTLVPATKLNSIIASIPIVGDILVGKKSGEGVIGVSFKMKGPPKDIKTSVNPIKTLTPRFIVRAIEKKRKKKKEKTK
jgi:hypothetical protein